jgi:hypothetical protein
LRARSKRRAAIQATGWSMASNKIIFLSPTPSPTDSAVYKAVFDCPGIGVPELRRRTGLPNDVINTALSNLVRTGWLTERIYDDGPGYRMARLPPQLVTKT